MICTNPIKFYNFTGEIAEENSQCFRRSISSLVKDTIGEIQPKVLYVIVAISIHLSMRPGLEIRGIALTNKKSSACIYE